jgi:methanogenic corrinoid protein MtbC1
MLDLNELSAAVGNLEEEKVRSLLREFVAGNPDEAEAQRAISACQNGMVTVGSLFEKGDYFIGDLIFAGELLTGVVDILKPVLGAKISGRAGKIVLGTVHKDLHDIGKNIFRNMAAAAGFEVFDLGIDQPVSAFVDKVREHKPDIVGLSGVLTLAIESMKETVEALKAAGSRDSIKVIIGGACASEEAMFVSGADAWSTNAAEGVNVCLGWVKNR